LIRQMPNFAENAKSFFLLSGRKAPGKTAEKLRLRRMFFMGLFFASSTLRSNLKP